MEQINVVGEKVLNVVLIGAYWVTMIGGAGQAINYIAKRDPQNALKTALNYGVAYFSIYILKWMLNLIRGAF